VVRAVVQRTLLRAGYQVVVATSAEEALELTEQDGGFALLVTDVVMPGMNGWELGKRLRARSPGLRVLYISGYTEDAAQEECIREPGSSFLQKPFLPVDLLSTLRKLLDAG
jgi:CheY-like chemotaxis protein